MTEVNTPTESTGLNGTTSDVLISATAQIVAAMIAAGKIEADGVPNFVTSIMSTLTNSDAGGPQPVEAAQEKQEPAVPIRKSITPDYLICLEDGKKQKMLKRYLDRRFNMSPDQYRAKWKLPNDYPMVAPNYAEQRRNLAKKIGLGTARKGISNKPAEIEAGAESQQVETNDAPAPKRRGRKPAVQPETAMA